MPRIIALANQKGGVGKTTSAINLAAALAASGERVLLLDLDPQGNASTGLGIGHTARGAGSYALLSGEQHLPALVRATPMHGLSIVPATPELAGAEVELAGLERREFRLREALNRPPGTLAAYSFVLMDCPPSLGLLTLNALVAAHGVLVPLQTEFLALEGLTQIRNTIERIRGGLNPSLRLDGILLTMFDRRNNLSESIANDARSFFGQDVFETVIPRNIRLSEAPSHGLPVALYDARSPGAQAYALAAEELLRRLRRPVPQAAR